MVIPNAKYPGYIGRIEALEAKRDDLRLDINEIYSEAKDDGVDVQALRHVIRKRKMDPKRLREFEHNVGEIESQLVMPFDELPVIHVEDEDKAPPFVGVHAAGV